MSEEKVMLTAEGVAKLKGELEHLLEIRRPEVLEKLKRAKERADTADSAEYEEAQNEQSYVEGRIAELERMLKDAEVISAERAKATYVKFGYKVTVQDESGEKKKYTIVGSPESAPSEGKISNESPVGRALLGKHVGDTVKVDIPRGHISLKILAISKK